MAERPAKVSFGFIDETPTQKGVFGDNVFAEMSDHPLVFPTPDVPLNTLKDVNDALKLKTQQALSGDKEKIQERDEAEKTWNTTFRKEGEYVQRVASGNKLIIVQSGYKSTDTESHPVAVPAQAQLDAWGNKGKGSGIHAEIKPLTDVRGIVFLLAVVDITSFASVKADILKLVLQAPTDIELQIELGTKRKMDFKDLTSGKTYFISAFGFNASGVGELANVIEVIAP